MRLKAKSIFTVILLVITLFSLTACNGLTPNPTDEEKATPVYQGMEVSETLSTLSANDSISANIMRLSNFGVTRNLNTNPIDQDDPFGTLDDGTISEVITNEFPVTQTEVSDYYSEINKDIFITVKLSNPDNFVILSFTLNGVFYQSYQFQDGSDSENLILKVNTGIVSGVKEYTIDAIKYIDGTDIKDAIFAGERTITVGLKHSSEPSVLVSNEVVNATSILLTVNLSDSQSLSTLNKIVLYDGTSLAQTYDLSLGENNIVFDKLNINTLYQYAVISVYDLIDGNNSRLSILGKKALFTDDIISIDNVVPTQTSIGFGITVTDVDQVGAVSAIELYKGETLVEALTDLSVREFTGLLSNNEYTIKITYTYDLNDGLGSQALTINQESTTVAKATPVVVVDNVVPTQTSIGFGITVTDVDQVGAVSAIELYKGETLVEALTDLSVREFTGLLSNNEYTIKVTYTYDLNDGVGELEFINSQAVTTVAKAAPSVTVENVVPTQTSIGFGITVTDTDEVGEISAIELYKGETLVEALTDLSVREFTGLLSNNEYTIKVTYTYDLNDGVGAQTLTINQAATTLAKATPTVAIVDVVETQEEISFELDVIDIDQVGAVTSIELFKDNELVESLEDLNSREFNNLLSNNLYEIKVTYSYDLNDGVGVQTVVAAHSVTTLTKATPTVEVINISSTKTSISFELDINDSDKVGSVIKVELYKDDELVKELEDLSLRTFDELLSDTEYKIKGLYSYDLNDGVGLQDLLFETHKYYTFSEYYNNPYNPHFTSGYIYAQIKEMPGSNEWYSGGHVIEPFTDSDDGNVPYMINLILDKPVSFAGLNIYSEYSIITVYCEYDGENYLGKADTFRFRKLDFNPVIKTQPKETPTLDIINIIETQNSVEFDLDITGSDDVGSVSKIALYKGDELVKELEDLSLRTFNDLLSNNEYEIKVIYSYDLNDGKGVRNLVVTKIFTTLSKTIPTVAIVDVVEIQEEISFELDVIDIDQVGAVTSIELFKDNELVESLEDLNSREFNNLLSNNLYEIKVTYSYDLNDGVGSQTLTINQAATTLAKATPTVVIDNVVPTQTSIGFGITVTDVDQVGAVSAIELYQGETLVETLTDLSVREFTGLLSNNEYTIKVTYTYDLNDGVGSQTLTINQAATTLAKATPAVTIDNVVPTQTSVEFGITITDADQVGEITAIELYKGETLIEALTNLSVREFLGLLSNNEYTIKVTYTYDLNDGVGEKDLIISQKTSTMAMEITISSISILNSGLIYEDQEILLRVNLTNPDNIEIDSLMINSTAYSVKSVISSTVITVLVDAYNIAGEYSLAFSQYSYSNSIDTHTISFIGNTEKVVNIYSEIEISDIFEVNENDYLIMDGESYLKIYLTNSSNFNIQSVEFEWKIDNILVNDNHTSVGGSSGSVSIISEEINFDFIDSGYILVPFSTPSIYFNGQYANGPIEISVKMITFSYNDKAYFVECNLNKMFVIIYNEELIPITSITDLQSMQRGYGYILQNDLDLTGVQWNPNIFIGYLDGNSYKISNLTIVQTYNSSSTQIYSGLFSIFSGVVKNLELDNIYISVTSNTSVRIGGLAGLSYTSVINNVKVTGYVEDNSDDSLIIGGLIGVHASNIVKQYNEYFTDNLISISFSGTGTIDDWIGYGYTYTLE